MHSFDKWRSFEPIKVAARESNLSRVQVSEVLNELRIICSEISFEPIFLETVGDRDLSTSLRTLGRTDFFTREIDQYLLEKKARIAVHSAKDLPDPIPKGLKLICLTKGLDPRDSVVLRDRESFFDLPTGSLVATSSLRREEVIYQLRPDLRFCDVRGKIEARIEKLNRREYDAVVIAEAALIRLGLTHLNRHLLSAPAALYQGQLAIIARDDDEEMRHLFEKMDSRHEQIRSF